MMHIGRDIVFYYCAKGFRPQGDAPRKAHMMRRQPRADQRRSQSVAEAFRKIRGGSITEYRIGHLRQGRAMLLNGCRINDNRIASVFHCGLDFGPGHFFQ